jgi:chaperonin cofactor prefoldin
LRWQNGRERDREREDDLFTMSGGNPLETELNTFRTIQSEISKVQGNISTAQTQILENELVLKVCAAAEPAPQALCAHAHACIRRRVQELDILEDDAGVFKLIGPVLVKQELLEVKNNVSKRIEFIKSDMCAPDLQLAPFSPLPLMRPRPAPPCVCIAASGSRRGSRTMRSRGSSARRTSPSCSSKPEASESGMDAHTHSCDRSAHSRQWATR